MQITVKQSKLIESKLRACTNTAEFRFPRWKSPRIPQQQNPKSKTKKYTRKLHVNACEEGKTIRRLRHTRLGNGHHATLARKWKTRRKSPLDTLPGRWHGGVVRTRTSQHRKNAENRPAGSENSAKTREKLAAGSTWPRALRGDAHTRVLLLSSIMIEYRIIGFHCWQAWRNSSRLVHLPHNSNVRETREGFVIV